MTQDLTADLEAGYRALHGAGGLVAVDRDLVHVVGPQAAEFLQGQLSQDVSMIASGTSALSFLLQPTGKVDAWFRVGPIDDGFAMDVAGGYGEVVKARLGRFKLRTKVDIDLVGTSWSHRAVRAARQLGPGVDILWPAVDGLAFADGDELPSVGIDACEAVRIECGVPAMGAELTEETIPGEMGQWIIDASVSFTKGCYTGQELVARIDSRGGNVPRPLRGVVLDGPMPPIGAELLVDDETVGRLTSVARSPELGVVALAPVARKVEVPADVILRWTGGEQVGQVRELPMLPPSLRR
jgi:folate-binding protein YgfZ